MKFHYLVDYENINEAGIAGLEHLGSEDTVYLFYTRNANKISFDFVSALLEQKIPSKLRIFRVANGKQSLDFQLLAYLGFLIGSETDPENFYLVVSKDGGFNNAVAFLRQNKLCERVRMVPSIDFVLQERNRSLRKNAAAETQPEAQPKAAQPEAVEKSSAQEGDAPVEALLPLISEEDGLSAVRSEEESAAAPAVPDAGETPALEGQAADRAEPAKEDGEADAGEESRAEKERPEDLSAEEKVSVESAPEQELADAEPALYPTGGEKPAEEEKAVEMPAEMTAEATAEKPAPMPVEESAQKKPEERKTTAGKRRGRKKSSQAPSGEAAASAAGAPAAPEALSAAAKKKLASERRAQINQTVQKILSKAKIEGDTISFVSSTVVKYFAEENGKQRIYREIVKKCGRQEGLALYRLIRSELE